MNEKFKNKYLKYKNKYLHLKKKKFKGGNNKMLSYGVGLITTIVVLAGLTVWGISNKDYITSNLDMFTRKVKKTIITRAEQERAKKKEMEKKYDENKILSTTDTRGRVGDGDGDDDDDIGIKTAIAYMLKDHTEEQPTGTVKSITLTKTFSEVENPQMIGLLHNGNNLFRCYIKPKKIENINFYTVEAAYTSEQPVDQDCAIIYNAPYTDLDKKRDTILEAIDNKVPQGNEELAGNARLHPLRLRNIYPDGLDPNPNPNARNIYPLALGVMDQGFFTNKDILDYYLYENINNIVSHMATKSDIKKIFYSVKDKNISVENNEYMYGVGEWSNSDTQAGQDKTLEIRQKVDDAIMDIPLQLKTRNQGPTSKFLEGTPEEVQDRLKEFNLVSDKNKQTIMDYMNDENNKEKIPGFGNCLYESILTSVETLYPGYFDIFITGFSNIDGKMNDKEKAKHQLEFGEDFTLNDEKLKKIKQIEELKNYIYYICKDQTTKFIEEILLLQGESERDGTLGHFQDLSKINLDHNNYNTQEYYKCKKVGNMLQKGIDIRQRKLPSYELIDLQSIKKERYGLMIELNYSAFGKKDPEILQELGELHNRGPVSDKFKDVIISLQKLNNKIIISYYFISLDQLLQYYNDPYIFGDALSIAIFCKIFKIDSVLKSPLLGDVWPVGESVDKIYLGNILALLIKNREAHYDTVKLSSRFNLLKYQMNDYQSEFTDNKYSNLRLLVLRQELYLQYAIMLANDIKDKKDDYVDDADRFMNLSKIWIGLVFPTDKPFRIPAEVKLNNGIIYEPKLEDITTRNRLTAVSRSSVSDLIKYHKKYSSKYYGDQTNTLWFKTLNLINAGVLTFKLTNEQFEDINRVWSSKPEDRDIREIANGILQRLMPADIDNSK